MKNGIPVSFGCTFDFAYPLGVRVSPVWNQDLRERHLRVEFDLNEATRWEARGWACRSWSGHSLKTLRFIPLDGSDLAEQVLEPARVLGVFMQAHFTLLRVYGPLVDMGLGLAS